MIPIRSHLYIAGALGLIAASGCSVADSEPEPAASQGGEATPADPSQSNANAPSDAQILLILSTVDRAEIEQGQLALNKAQSPRVREFASSMIQQHTASSEEGAQIASTNGMTPQSSSAATELQRKAAQTLNELGSDLGLTAERIRQIEKEALEKLRDAAAKPPDARGDGT